MIKQGEKMFSRVNAPKVHLAQYRCGAQGKRCGKQGRDWFSSLLESEVTCKRCMLAIRNS